MFRKINASVSELEELRSRDRKSLGLLSSVKPSFKLIQDLLTSSSESWSISRGRSAQINAMAAVVAIDKDSKHVLLSILRILQMAHSCPLPRVFNGVCEDNVVSSDVEAAVLLDVIVDFRLSDWAENSLAVRHPVGRVDQV
jgi:hypothetical protein